MIIGIGTDMVEIPRVDRIMTSRMADKFLERVLTRAEQQEIMSRGSRAVEYVAGRFAVKEAVAKALGCGIGRIVGFQDMSIEADPFGKPICKLSQSAWRRLEIKQKAQIHTTITHTNAHALAFVIIEAIR